MGTERSCCVPLPRILAAWLTVALLSASAPTVASTGSGGGGSFADAADTPPVHELYNTYSWVDPNKAFVLNGELVWATVRHDLSGQSGVAAKVLADAIDVYYNPAPNYRKSVPGTIRANDVANLSSLPSQCRWFWSCKQVDERDKVWFSSVLLGVHVIMTWYDTYTNGYRSGVGYYKRNGERFARFDEVVPAFGGVVRKDSRGLIWIDVPTPAHRTRLEAGEMCAILGQLECNISSFVTPEAVSYHANSGSTNALTWVLGLQADMGETNKTHGQVFFRWNESGLRWDGKKPTALQRLDEAADKLALTLSAYLLLQAGVESLLLRYNPAVAMSGSPEYRLRIGMAIADKVDSKEVARTASQFLGGKPVLPENSRPPSRGWHYLIRTMSRPAANAQRLGADAEIYEVPGFPGKYVVREWGSERNGVWFDGYACGVCLDAKGNYGWTVKDGKINPAFIKNDAIPDLAKGIDRQLRAARAHGDVVRWVLDEEPFMQAFTNDYLKNYRPDLYRLIGTELFFQSLK